MNSIRPVLLLCLLPMLHGCGESTKDQMLRVAQQRAQRNKSNAEQTTVLAGSAVETVAGSGSKASKGEPSPIVERGATTVENRSSEDSHLVVPEDTTLGNRQSHETPNIDSAVVATAMQEDLPASSPSGASIVPSSERTSSSESTEGKNAEFLFRKKIWLSPDGQYAAFTVSEDAIQVLDIESEKIVQQFATPNLDPTTIAFGNANRISVGSRDGGVKFYELGQNEELDQFGKSRQRHQETQRPSQLHDYPVSAIAFGEQLGVSGDTLGNLHAWRATASETHVLNGLKSRPQCFQSLQNGRLIFAASEDGSIHYWQQSADPSVYLPACEYGKLPGKPVIMQSMLDGKGIVVADDSGMVSLTLSSATGVTKSTHQLADTDIVGIALAGDGDSLLYATSAGRIVEQPLPMPAAAHELARSNREILSFDSSEDAKVGVFVDGSSDVTFIQLATGETLRTLTLEECQLTQVAVNPQGKWLAVAGQRASGAYFMATGAADDALANSVALANAAESLLFSDDGSRLACASADGAIGIYSPKGRLLERIPSGSCGSSFVFSSDATKIIYDRAESNAMVVQPLVGLESVEISSDPIIKTAFVPTLSSFVCATPRKLYLFKPGSSGLMQFLGAEGTLVDVCLSPDGRRLAALTDYESGGKVTIWILPTDFAAGERVGPALQLGNAPTASAIAFSPDSKHALLGGLTGLIHAWNVSENREVARFSEHEMEVTQIAPRSELNKFVSYGNDRSFCSWDFPHTITGPGEPVARGMLAAIINESSIKPISISSVASAEHSYDDLRRALLADSDPKYASRWLFNGLGDDPQLRQTVRTYYAELIRVRAAIAAGNATAEQLAGARRNFSSARAKLLPSVASGDSTSFVDDHQNLLFSCSTDFDFTRSPADSTANRPVRLRVSNSGFLYAARASAPFRDDESDLTMQESGKVLGWDFGFSGLQTCSWSQAELDVKSMGELPGSQGIVTGPNLTVFPSQGPRHHFADTATTWAVSPTQLHDGAQNETLYAVGLQGPENAQGPVLEIYSSSVQTPIASFAAYDGVVTAVAFAHRHPQIAFSVRDRATTKVFIGNSASLSADSLTLVFEHQHAGPFRGASGGLTGVQSLAFSPNDDVLVGHGHFEKSEKKDDDLSNAEHCFKGWIVEQRESGKVKTSVAFEDFKSESPLLVDDSPLSLRFMQGIDFSLEKYLRLASQTSRRSRSKQLTAAGDLKVVFESGGKATVYSLLNSKALTTVNLKDPPGISAYSITQDGRWLIAGTEQGTAKIWDLNADNEYELTLNQRPAHTGPIVGVTLSDTDPILGIPEFAATAGEENQIKVWDLIPVLKPTVVQATN